jgi:hypothetical protein
MFILFTDTSSVGQPTENSPLVEITSPISNGPVPLTIDQITQSEITTEDSLQVGTTHVDQESAGASIQVSIRDDGVATSTVKSKIVQRSKSKNRLKIIFRNQILIIDLFIDI